MLVIVLVVSSRRLMVVMCSGCCWFRCVSSSRFLTSCFSWVVFDLIWLIVCCLVFLSVSVFLWVSLV